MATQTMPTHNNLFQSAARVSFVLYTLALLTATHWPGLSIKGPVSRTDLIIHAGAFGVWTLLLGATGWVRSKSCIRRQALIVGLIGIAYSIFDETTQPIFNRVFDLLDLAADSIGVILASLFLLVIWYRNNGGQCKIEHASILRSETLAEPSPETRS